MSDARITTGPYEFAARWERERSPETCEAFEKILRYRQKIIHVRWSVEACWIPTGDYDLVAGFEDATSYPQAGEILLPYYGTHFKSKLGTLGGSHLLTITEGRESLYALGQLTLWEGAQDIDFENA